jgi:hypothetical protein
MLVRPSCGTWLQIMNVNFCFREAGQGTRERKKAARRERINCRSASFPCFVLGCLV